VADRLGEERVLVDALKADVRALTEVLDSLAAAAHGETVHIEELVESLGRRSFPALVLAPSLVAVSPASGIPGMTSTVGLLVATITAQMLWGRKSAWLPGFLMGRQITVTRLRSALHWLRRPVAFLERFTKPRLVRLATRPFVILPLSAMLTIGLAMPMMEFIPMSGTIAGALLSIYAIGLLMRDGVLVVLALGLSAAAPWGVWQLAT
jgi:hypothetical protein